MFLQRVRKQKIQKDLAFALVQESAARVRNVMVSKGVRFCDFCSRSADERAQVFPQYYTEVSVPQNDKKSRKIGEGARKRARKALPASIYQPISICLPAFIG